MAAPLAAHAGARRPAPPQKKEEGKDKKKDDKAGKEEKPKLSKQERKYQEIKKFSLDLYNKDEEFRDSVDDAYRNKQREQTEYAFDINTRNGFDQVRRDGDKLKIYDALYDNPLAQDYVNRLGQSLVPDGTSKLYAFKITLNPIPEARALSTGTVYISTGLLSQVDNEAQLAYILSHEVAHIEKDHWREDVLVAQGVEPFNEKQAKKRALWGAVIGAATAGITGAAGGGGQAAYNNAIIAGLVIAPTLLKFVIPNAVNSWDRIQEDEADQLGLKYMLDRSYDPREVPKLFASMQNMARLDRRVGLGFMGDPDRLNERLQMVNSIVNGLTTPRALLVGSIDLASKRGLNVAPTGDFTAEMKSKLDAGELIGSTAEFEAIMAELKRDNGIRAYYYDMFQMSRDNLEESLLIRSNDPYSHFYYGKVLKLTARNSAEKSRALAEFVRAVELDKRRVLPEARLHRALALIENKEPSQLPEIVSTLKEYVSLYQREHGGQLPSNMDVIYDYMQEANELNWSAPPVMNISTKNVEPIVIASPNAPTRPAESAPATTTPSAQRPAPSTGGRRP
jgi:predicted Zn-dependent protease